MSKLSYYSLLTIVLRASINMTYLLIMLQSSILHYKKTIKSDVGNKLVLSNIMLVSLNAINNIKGPLNMTFVPSYICTIISDLGIIQFASSKQKRKKKKRGIIQFEWKILWEPSYVTYLYNCMWHSYNICDGNNIRCD